MTPKRWSINYLQNLFNFEWVKTKSPAGATQWIPENGQASNLVPDAHIKGKRHAPIMFTTDIALKADPEFRKISERFLNDPNEFELAFAKAWFKVDHRDLGPRARYLVDFVPEEVLIWQDCIPAVDHKLVDGIDIASLKASILDSGLSVSEPVRVGWASAASYPDTDMRGGANGSRIRFTPQKD